MKNVEIEKLEKITNVEVINNSALEVAKNCFNEFDKNGKGRYVKIKVYSIDI